MRKASVISGNKKKKRFLLIVVNTMEFIREIRRVEGSTITIQLPEDYEYQEVEVLILPFESSLRRETLNSRSFESLKHISIDTRKYKFNREELHA